MKYSNSKEYISKNQFKEILINRPTIPNLSNYTSTTKKSPKAAQKTRSKKIDKKPSNIQLKPIPRNFGKDLWVVHPGIDGMPFCFKL